MDEFLRRITDLTGMEDTICDKIALFCTCPDQINIIRTRQWLSIVRYF